MRAVDTWIPGVAAVEEQVLLVRRDSGAVFNIRRINLWAKIPRFGPRSIGSSQDQVQVEMPIPSWLILLLPGSYNKGLIRGRSRIASSHWELDNPGPCIVLIRSVKRSAFGSSTMDVDIIIRCYRTGKFGGWRAKWRSKLLWFGPSTWRSNAAI